MCGGVGDNAHDCVSECLSEALKAISVSTELVEEELKPHLDVLLNLLLEKSEFTPMYQLTTPRSNYTSVNPSFHKPVFSFISIRLSIATTNPGAMTLMRACKKRDHM